MKSEKLLVLSLIFPPDGVSSSQLLGEIVTDLAPKYNKLTVITTTPHYNLDEQAREKQPISWGITHLLGYSSFSGVKVIHIRMPSKAAGKVGRLLQWIWFHIASFFIAIKFRSEFDKILTISPPLTVAVVCLILKKITGKPYMFAVWELYPDILVSLDLIKLNGLVYKTLKWLEKKSYANAGAIAVLHDAMMESVVKTEPCAVSKTFVIPTFADIDWLTPLDQSTSIREEYKLGDQFVILYAGNMGKPQNLGLVLDAALLLTKHEKISFLFCGDGSEKKSLMAHAEKIGLQNTIFTDHMPYTRVPEIYATCNASIVPLAQNVSSEALPSKIYRSLACGRAILGICDSASPLAKLIQDNEVGVVSSSNDPDKLAQVILNLSSNNSVLKYQENARALAVSKFSRVSVTNRYSAVLDGI